jgi:hypothetical protein
MDIGRGTDKHAVKASHSALLPEEVVVVLGGMQPETRRADISPHGRAFS